MRSIAVAIVLSAALVALLSVDHLNASPLWTAPVMVIIGVIAACTVAGGITWLAIVSGALGVFAFGWLSAWSPTLGLIVMNTALLVPRAVLVRTKRDLVVFGACAATGAVIGGLVTSHFAQAPILQHIASCIFAGAAIAVSYVVVRVDTPAAHALRTAGQALDGEVGAALVRLADAHGSQAALGASTPRLRDLVREADARVALRRASGPDAESKRRVLDQRILEQIAAFFPLDTTESAPTELPSQTPPRSEPSNAPTSCEPRDEPTNEPPKEVVAGAVGALVP